MKSCNVLHMKTRREALAEVGLAKAGARGKFSKEAMAWLADQKSKGAKFSDDNGIVRAPSTGAKSEGAPSKESAGMVEYLFPDEYRFPEKEYRAFVRVGGKKKDVSLRECCSNCRVSLVNHSCNSPVIHGNVVVTIEPVPLKKK